MYVYRPFAEIEKNKWNGTVHYSPNGNPFGYFWYLKAVVSEWGAIIEDEYESVMPVFCDKLTRSQYRLLTEVGPYSMNQLNSTRVKFIYELLQKHNHSSRVSLMPETISRLPDESYLQENKVVFSGMMSYEKVRENYSDALKRFLDGKDASEDVKVISGIKPEDIVANLKEPADYKNALLRIMYNAMHRGIGFSSGITSKKSGKQLAVSFFIASHNAIYELTSHKNGGKQYRQLIFDLLLRTNAEKPNKIYAYQHKDELFEMGMDTEPYYYVNVKDDKFTSLKEMLGMKV